MSPGQIENAGMRDTDEQEGLQTSSLSPHYNAVRNEVDFLRLDDVEDQILEASLAEYQQYLNQLDAARTDLDELLTSTAATLDQLANISQSFKAVDDQTQAFQAQSAGIVEQQKHNEQIAAGIADNLRFYEPLERIARRMNAPGAGSFVRTQDFRDMLNTLDECIDYMQTHTSHKEAEIYRARYKQLLTRALTLVRNTFMVGARDITNEVAKRIADKQLNDTTMSALLYAKFRVDAPTMKDIGLEIQKRAAAPADAEPGTEGEYQSLMNELHQAFAACRARLVLPIVQKQLADTASNPSSGDLVQFARSSITFVRGVCLDEFELWGEWFHGQRGVYDFLESVCEPLYDALRPRVLHESRLSKLCSLVTLLQTRFLKDEEEEMDLTQLDFSVLIQPLVEDAQTRLVFRTLALLRDQIEYFKPSADDLDFPRKTSSPPVLKSAAPLSGKKGADSGLLDDDNSGDEGALWTRNRVLHMSYPTLPRAVRLLSRIYRLVNSSIFDDLAHQIVHQTTVSLVSASQQISQKSSPTDGSLFLLRHLLLLKSQIVAFDIEYVAPDVAFDFSGMTSTFFELRERGGLFNPRSWVRLFTTGGLLPRVVENMLDAKVELDGRLRSVINDFTAASTATVTAGLNKVVLSPSSTFSLSHARNQSNGSVNGTANQTKAEEIATNARAQIEKEVPVIRAKLEQYIDDSRTRETLVAAIEDQVVQAYESFFEQYERSSHQIGHGDDPSRAGGVAKGKGKGATNGQHATTTGGGAGAGAGKVKISRKGKGAETEVWDPDTFAEWAETVFNVALPHHVDEDDHDGYRDGSVLGSRSRSRSISRSGTS